MENENVFSINEKEVMDFYGLKVQMSLKTIGKKIIQKINLMTG